VVVGVISNGFNKLGGMAQDVLNGDLPTDFTAASILREAPGPKSDEGRAMAQLIHTVAPGASILFADGATLDPTGVPESSEQGLADAINLLVQHHARVIVDDEEVFSENFWQADGPVAQAISDAAAKGVVFVTSAGNSGKAYYEHSFGLTATAQLKAANGTALQTNAFDFNLGQQEKNFYQSITLSNEHSSDHDINLHWQPKSGAPSFTITVSLYVKDGDGYDFIKRVTSSGKDSLTLGFSNNDVHDAADVYLAISSPDPQAGGVLKYIMANEGGAIINDPNAGLGSGAIYGHKLHPNEIAVGSIDYTKAQGLVNEHDSSFGADGTGSVPVEPAVSGIDGVSTDVGGVSKAFFGTSAAAPTVAAVAALMLQVNPELTPAEVKAMLQQSASPTNSAEQGGAGLVQAQTAVALATADAARPRLAFTDTSTGGQGTAKMDAVATDAPNYLRWQYIASGSDSMAFASQTPNLFIHGGSGDDAIAVSSGRNVIDGGAGSNFLVGGTGNDTFFTDARAPGVVWNTISNFHVGDAVTLWGFDAAVSTYRWEDGLAGAEGAKGATLHANIAGIQGRVGDGFDASITFAGMSVEQARGMLHTTGEIQGGAGKYLYILNQGA
jgi:subtilisin family serine protease